MTARSAVLLVTGLAITAIAVYVVISSSVVAAFDCGALVCERDALGWPFGG